MTNLFQTGDFTLHSGGKARWKIDCDALDNEDLVTLAAVAAAKVRPYGYVHSIPKGGDRLKTFMLNYAIPVSTTHLIVDDVLTTGKSMESKRRDLVRTGYQEKEFIGLVIFAHVPTPEWITALFTFTD